MFRMMILIMMLAVTIAFNWDKVPQPVKNLLGDVKTVSGEVYENGKDMPDPVAKYVAVNITPKAKKIKEIILE